MMFDAVQIARGWLSVATASSSDKGRPVLHKTIRVEQHAHGLRLVATDSYVLLHAWVPELGHESDPPATFDEAPIATATAMDPHGRGRGFLAHVLKLATTKVGAAEPEQIDVRVRLNVLATPDAQQGQLVGLEALTLVLEYPDVERVVLDVHEGVYPVWRAVLDVTRQAVPSAHVVLTPELVGRVVKAALVHPCSRLSWSFTDDDGPAVVAVLDSDPFVHGLVMPCRWDFDTNAPRIDELPPDDDDGQADEVVVPPSAVRPASTGRTLVDDDPFAGFPTW